MLTAFSAIVVWCGPLVRLYLLEPVPGGVPTLTAVLILVTPQMADMMAAVSGGFDPDGTYRKALWHECGFGFATPLLGFQGWFWMRAALNARAGDRDTRLSAKKSWAEVLAPRLILFPALLIGLSPLISAAEGRMEFGAVPWFGVGIACVLMALLFVLIWQRQRIVPPRFAAAPLPRLSCARLIAAAPIHPGVAVASLVLGLIGFAAPLLAPNAVNDGLHTADAALLAMACLVPVGTMLLALFRDGIDLMLRRLGFTSRSSPGAFAVADVFGVMLLLALPALGGWLSDTLRLYDVSPRGKLADRPTVDRAAVAWKSCRDPIVVVIEGGASRSAAWSLSMMAGLDAASDGRFSQQIFAISSVSGGSLGAVTYAMLRARADATQSGVWQGPQAQAGLVALARADLLSASVFRMLTTDALLGIPTRGPALSTAFEHLWSSNFGFADAVKGKPGLLQLRSSADCAPHLLLNGTDTATGSRVITSTLDLENSPDVFADTVDALAKTRADVSAADAVLSSARFPIISPPGAVRASSGAPSWTVVDGGVFEGLGARTAAELVAALVHAKLNPIVVVIRNDGDEAKDAQPPCAVPEALRSDPGSSSGGLDPAPLAAGQQRGVFVPEFLTSLLGLNAARGAHARVELAALRASRCSSDPLANNYFDFDLPMTDRIGNPGVPMNWVLDSENCKLLLGPARRTRRNAGQAAELAIRLRTPGFDATATPEDRADMAAARIAARGDEGLCGEATL